MACPGGGRRRPGPGVCLLPSQATSYVTYTALVTMIKYFLRVSSAGDGCGLPCSDLKVGRVQPKPWPRRGPGGSVYSRHFPASQRNKIAADGKPEAIMDETRGRMRVGGAEAGTTGLRRCGRAWRACAVRAAPQVCGRAWRQAVHDAPPSATICLISPPERGVCISCYLPARRQHGRGRGSIRHGAHRPEELPGL